MSGRDLGIRTQSPHRQRDSEDVTTAGTATTGVAGDGETTRGKKRRGPPGGGVGPPRTVRPWGGGAGPPLFKLYCKRTPHWSPHIGFPPPGGDAPQRPVPGVA